MGDLAVLLGIIVRRVLVPEVRQIVQNHNGPAPITDEEIIAKLSTDAKVVIGEGQAFLDRTAGQ